MSNPRYPEKFKIEAVRQRINSTISMRCEQFRSLIGI